MAILTSYVAESASSSVGSHVESSPTPENRLAVADEYAAFISYSSRYREWVRVLQTNLEKCLAHVASPRQSVFLDQVDLVAGRSWISQLEEGLIQAVKVILVLTPEAVASPRVEDEWQTVVDQYPNWQRSGVILPIQLLWTPVSPFLSKVQRLDFTEAENYRTAMQRLVGALIGRPPRRMPELPQLDKPEHPETGLPEGFRKSLIEWMEPFLRSKLSRAGLASALRLQSNTILEGHASPELAASALWVHAKGDRDELDATRRLIRILVEVLEEDAPEAVSRLKTLANRLETEPPEVHDRSLPRYLEVVRQDHSRLLPFFEPGAQSELLEKVYVHLGLQPRPPRSSSGNGQGKTAGSGDEAGVSDSMTLRELLNLDRTEHSWITGRWVVRGDPGSGKTTLLRHLALTLAEESDPPWIPIFLSLARLLREGCSVLDRVANRLKLGGLRLERQHFQDLGREGRLLVLLDGLDEVPAEKREDAEALLLDLIREWPETPIVVSTRKIGYILPHSSFRELDVQPLGREQQRRFLARRLRDGLGQPDGERAERTLQIVEQQRHLRALARNPLSLTLISLLVEQGAPLSGHRAQLYDEMFTLLLSGEHRRRLRSERVHAIERPAAVRQALRHLAYEMSRQNLDTLPKEDLEDLLEADHGIAHKLNRCSQWSHSWACLDDIGELTGILGPHDGVHEDWRFWHRTFREALTAERLEDLYREDAAQIVEQARAISDCCDGEKDKSRWAEAFAMLVGRLDTPDALLLSLFTADENLGLRAFEGVRHLEEATLRQLLNHEDFRVRRAIYRRLPDLLDDPHRVLEEIDTLRQQTRNGNDLFFLDLTARRVGKLWPQAKNAADRLRSRLLDHIPKPPADLFRWIKTRDGRVPLWREIPNGAFLMGSPVDEDGRCDHEEPPHEVAIQKSFSLACVQVTQEQFAAFDPDHESHHRGPQHPVENVSWFQAVSFCRWLSRGLDWARGARLPREEEWEYACRAGTTTRFWNGEYDRDLGRVGWYSKNSVDTHPVGEKPANPWGLYDVHGNVWEWTCSRGGRAESPTTLDPRTDAIPALTSSAGERVIRGGCYWYTSRLARSGFRSWSGPGVWSRNLGFRVLLPGAPGGGGGRVQPS